MNYRKLQITFAITVSLINIYLAGLYGGYENGYTQTMNTYKSLIGFKISEGTTYGTLAVSHFAIFLCIGFFIVFKLLGQRVVFRLLAGLACLLAIWKSIYWGWALKYIGEGYNDSFYDLIRETVFLGWISVVLIVLLAVFHLVSIFQIKEDRLDP